MKKILLLFLMTFIVTPSFAAIDTWFNTNPFKQHKEEINLKKIYSDIYDKDGINIKKNLFQFKYSYKEGRPYEYLITNNTDSDLFLKGVDSEYHANKNITRKSHWTRVNVRYYKYWHTYVPFADDYFGARSTIEQKPYLYDFPKNYTIKPGDSLRILAMGLELKKIQTLTFIFENNGQELKIEF